jgi:hypothetical protein
VDKKRQFEHHERSTISKRNFRLSKEIAMDEFLVTDKHGRGRPAVVGLGLEFVVVWTAPGDQILRGARFDLAGRKQAEFQVNTTPGIAGLVKAERIRRGFVVVWVTLPPIKVVYQRFGLDGAKAGPEVLVSGTNVVGDLDRMRVPGVAPTLDGKFVVSWVAALPEPQIRAAIFDSEDGGRVGPEISVNTSPGSHFAPSVVGFAGAGLDDVTFAIAWKGGENGIFRSRFQLFNFDGTKAGPETVPRRTGVGEIAPVTFGGQNVEDPREFFSVLGGINGTEGQKLTADLFVREGTSLGVTVSGDDMINFDPSIKALPHGGSIVTWTQKPIPTSGKFDTRVMAAIVGVASGPPDFPQVLGSARRVGATDVGGQISASPMVDDFGGSNIAFAWIEQPFGSSDSIKARVLSSTLT